MRVKNLEGQKFGRLTVVKRVERKSPKAYWLCKCDCGNEHIVCGASLTRGKVLSCGCYAKEKLIRDKTTHGGSGTRLYVIYRNMKRRCLYEKDREYPYYGERGITICDEWKGSFEKFRSWANKNGYSDSLTLDRIDNNGNYCPENCRWATMEQQNNNTRACVFVTINGETHTLSQWCKINNINYYTVMARRRAGWSNEDAVTVPVNSRRRRKNAGL